MLDLGLDLSDVAFIRIVLRRYDEFEYVAIFLFRIFRNPYFNPFYSGLVDVEGLGEGGTLQLEPPVVGRLQGDEIGILPISGVSYLKIVGHIISRVSFPVIGYPVGRIDISIFIHVHWPFNKGPGDKYNFQINVNCMILFGIPLARSLDLHRIDALLLHIWTRY